MQKFSISGITYVMLALLISFTYSCKEDEPPIPLVAKAGADVTVAPNETVTLDASASTPSENVSYKWTYVSGPADIPATTTPQWNIGQERNEKIITFQAIKNGQYFFRLTITRGNEFSEDEITITISGSLILSGPITTATTLSDISTDIDYIVNSDLVLNARLIISGSVTIQFASTAGIVIESGGSLVNEGNAGLILTATSGWKGILIKAGSLDITLSVIEKAGATAHTGYTQAAITQDGGSINNLTSITFSSSSGVNLHILQGSINNVIGGNTFDLQNPIIAPFASVDKIVNNTIIPVGGFVTLIGKGESTAITSTGSGGTFTPMMNVDYLIKGGLNTSSPINLDGIQNKKITFENGTGWICGGDFFRNSPSALTISAQAGGTWKGIYFARTVQLKYVSIENAGSATFAGSVTTTNPAAAYFANSGAFQLGTLDGSSIKNSQGYGIYIDGVNGTIGTGYTNFTLENNLLGGVSLPASLGPHLFPGTFTIVSPNAPAVIMRDGFMGNSAPTQPFKSLGAGNFYKVMQNLTVGNTLTLSPGVHMKFDGGKSLFVPSGRLIANGTAASPIILEGDGAGWRGVLLEFAQLSSMQYVTIKKGGSTALGSEPANLALKGYNASQAAALTFTNCTFSEGFGYGVLNDLGSSPYDFLDVSRNNTFTNNQLGTQLNK